ncbi:MAG TPA: ATP-binding protein [Candidatus Eisenbacteria bacterium]|nr:ATP-binding protein [Candidatus Eisenbacteria bacterium]
MTQPGAQTPERSRILVVDDEENVVQILVDLLSEGPYTVDTVSSGEEALSVLRSQTYDLILTDINLPGVNGLEVVSAAKEADPETVVVVITGYASTGTAIDALRQGAYDYITKPFDLWELDQIVARGLGSRRLVLENRRLVQNLQTANAELRRHEEALRDEVDIATRRIRTLYEISKDVNASLDVHHTLDFIVGQAAMLTHARLALLFRSRENAARLTAEVGYGPAEAATGTAVVTVGRGVIGRVAETLEPARAQVVDPAELSEPFFMELGVRSVLAVPLLHKGRLQGVLSMMEKERGGFTEEDQDLLESFAYQAALALANAELYETARELERMKSEFVAVVSHEVRTPLTAIQGSLELVLDDRYFQMADKMRELLTICQANVEKLRTLINEILDFSKLEANRLSLTFLPIDMVEVAHEVVASMEGIADPKSIRLRLDAGPEIPVIQADRMRVGQVLTNLIGNALKFTPPGGQVDVILETHPDGGVVCAVSDNGPGIASNQMGKLFQKFQQLDSSMTREKGGTGLGLVISKGLVEGHGGRIWVESEVGVGSRFCFMLPERPPILDRDRDGAEPTAQAA